MQYSVYRKLFRFFPQILTQFYQSISICRSMCKLLVYNVIPYFNILCRNKFACSCYQLLLLFCVEINLPVYNIIPDFAVIQYHFFLFLTFGLNKYRKEKFKYYISEYLKNIKLSACTQNKCFQQKKTPLQSIRLGVHL